MWTKINDMRAHTTLTVAENLLLLGHANERLPPALQAHDLSHKVLKRQVKTFLFN